MKSSSACVAGFSSPATTPIKRSQLITQLLPVGLQEGAGQERYKALGRKPNPTVSNATDGQSQNKFSTTES